MWEILEYRAWYRGQMRVTDGSKFWETATIFGADIHAIHATDANVRDMRDSEKHQEQSWDLMSWTYPRIWGKAIIIYQNTPIDMMI